MVQCRKINSRDCRSNRFAVSAVAATVTATAVVLVLVAAAITATAIDTVIYIDRDKNRLGPQPPPPPRQGGEPVGFGAFGGRHPGAGLSTCEEGPKGFLCEAARKIRLKIINGTAVMIAVWVITRVGR